MSSASFALLIFVPLTIIAFAIWRPAIACASVFLGASLFLPERIAFDVVGLPPYEKYTAPTFTVLLACVLFYSSRLKSLKFRKWPEVLCVVLILSAVGTVVTNPDAIFYEGRAFPKLRAWDFINMSADDTLKIILPFLFGTLFYRNSRDLKDLLRVFVVFALIYIPFIILELALSPQLHRWVYGYHPHMFSQSIRLGGYRPVVFTIHGLALSLFFCCATLATFGLGRAKTVVFGLPTKILGPFFAVILILCKSASAIVYFLFVIPIVSFFSSRSQLRVAVAACVLILSYPAFRIMDLVPTDALVAFTKTLSDRHSVSLKTRFDSEELLLENVKERPLFGWGGFSRARVLKDGGYVQIVDGYWVIRASQRGFVGLGVTLGMLLVPLFIAAGQVKRLGQDHNGLLLATLSLIIVVYSVDLLPNSISSGISFFLAGALLSLSRNLPREKSIHRSTARRAFNTR